MYEDIGQSGDSKALSLHYERDPNYVKIRGGFFSHLFCNDVLL